MQKTSPLVGVLFGVTANMIWGLAFLLPAVLPTSDAVGLAVARYLSFGLLSLVVVAVTRGAGMRGLGRRVWLTALAFAFAGHLGYYLFLVQGIGHAGAPITTVIIGTLPVTVALAGNWARKEFPLSRLALPLGAIVVGLVLVNLEEVDWHNVFSGHSGSSWVLGIGAALTALGMWTWYAVANANFLRRHPEIAPITWSTMMGVGALVLSLVALPIAAGAGAIHVGAGHSLLPVLGGGLLLGMLVSWFGTVLWNRASGSVPISIAGQLAVIQMISGLIYVFTWDSRMPPPVELVGIALLIGGVLLAIQRIRTTPEARRVTADAAPVADAPAAAVESGR
ncbi:DMT family transporter [Streptacidiphilus jiangxiensis]|uniref:EamA-like transporter family protein n=1 Tax=Streptacidiphilus jiangxiensis TaxID=235985 RepID=A0A1H7KXC0_STRJI|nr:DMT family transporter [Streptacidiphilus jiangxiensis]SEK91214.1 EamA-like transporter family protein [Streptacidiphilus jiangxiensis]